MKSFIKYVFATGVGVVMGCFMVFILFFGIIGAIIAIADKENAPVQVDSGYLMIELNKKIQEKGNKVHFEMDGLFEKYQTMGLYEIKLALKKAAKDEKIKGVYLKLRNPRGGISTLKAIRDALVEFKKSKKPIYAYSDLMSERAYYLATVADTISMHELGDFEFNGLAAVKSYMRGLFDKLEVKPIIFRVGKYKSPIEPLVLKKMSAEDRHQTEQFLGDIWGELLTATSQSRKISPATLKGLADNLSVMSSKSALKYKMIDRLVVESDLIKEMRKKAKIEEDQEKFFIPLAHYLRGLKDDDKDSDDKIAILFAEGVIVTGKGGKDKIGSDSLVKQIRKIREDEDIKGVILRIDSPGGSAFAADVMWSELRLLAKEKPLYASFSNIAASGGYYIAMAASKIYSAPMTLTGSIGVFGIMLNTKDFFNKKTGITFDRVTTNRYSDIGNSSRVMTPMEKRSIQKEVDNIYLRFLHVVKAGRKFKRDQDVDVVAQGRIWSGVQAKKVGLVDKIGGLDVAIQDLAKELKLKEYGVDLFPKRDGLQEVFAQFGSALSLKDFTWKLLGIDNTPLESGIYALNPIEIKID